MGLGVLVVLVAAVGVAENNGDKLGFELATMAPTRSSGDGEGAPGKDPCLCISIATKHLQFLAS